MNPQRARLDSQRVSHQHIPLGALLLTPTSSVPCLPSLLLGFLMVLMASDLYKISAVSPQQRNIPTSPLAATVTEKGDKEGHQVCHWPRFTPSSPYNHSLGSSRAPGLRWPWHMSLFNSAIKQALIPQNTNKELSLL